MVVIEHHLDVIKSADYLIDLGPEGGSGGGSIVLYHITSCKTRELSIATNQE